ncbi:MAG: hemerythrin domain-containing protein [Planctomycetota bacterium]
MSETLLSELGRTTQATSASRVTVNAAFLKEIKDDNRQLKSMWDKVTPLLSHSQTAKNHWTELVEALSELRDQLAMHFSLEEAFGYFDEAIDIAPRLSMVAVSLRSEHATLFATARDLADSILEIDGEQVDAIGEFVARFNRFRRDFERHEEAELRLILSSFDDDLGGGD